jgi:hypothetical protein
MTEPIKCDDCGLKLSFVVRTATPLEPGKYLCCDCAEKAKAENRPKSCYNCKARHTCGLQKDIQNMLDRWRHAFEKNSNFFNKFNRFIGNLCGFYIDDRSTPRRNDQ